ncbi:hypothetical protein K8O68_13600 [Salipaludibacillus sp. CUR1]|uniref:hypothetical protein n=1 Tax=Salipaludibacillus sp. CUR1 TaxID=2820003 RepID=UPI001E59E4D7|nr:hypothetical protein [Salipaludibacillus sp. CUR1]MCE7793455.1 hypothetical protein [Salipaludibacillus sp. CUR1]
MKRLNAEQLRNRVRIVKKVMELENSSYNLEAGEVKIQNQNFPEEHRKVSYSSDGYANFSIRDSANKKYMTVYLHHIVMILADAEQYIEQMSKGMTINHISGDKADNSLNNLEYLSQTDNIIHAYVIGLKENKAVETRITEYQAYEMLEGFYQSERSIEELAEAFDLPKGAINKILNGKEYRGLFVMFRSLNKTDAVRRKGNKLTALQVRQMLREYHDKGVSQTALAKEYKVSRAAVGMIVAGRRWTDLYEEYFQEMA